MNTSNMKSPSNKITEVTYEQLGGGFEYHTTYCSHCDYWTPDQKISYDTGRPYDKVTPNEDTWSRDRSVPYEGYRSPNEPRALLVDPQLGTLRFAPNQDSYGNPNYGTSGGWNSDFSGGGGSGGGYTDFSGTASA